MRISDWSSDVCSSDLPECDLCDRIRGRRQWTIFENCFSARSSSSPSARQKIFSTARANAIFAHGGRPYWRWQRSRRAMTGIEPTPNITASRSEEHTSELQSLMRISYAVFCLKKKTTHKHEIHNQPLYADSTPESTKINNI